MNTLKKIKNIILNNHLTVVITSSKTNTLFIMNLLDQLSIKDNIKLPFSVLISKVTTTAKN